MKIEWHIIRSWIFKHLTWILIVLSLLCFIISQKELFTESANDLIEKAGLTMLSSGIFTAVLKSLQFTGLFKEEISNVMTSSDFIEKRSDVNDLWKIISKCIYKKKFPKISNLLEDKILQNYFPTNSDYYYENYHVSINIEEINDDFEISYTQTCEYNVILAPEQKEAVLRLRASISDDDSPTSSIQNELVYFKENDEDIELEEDESTKDDPRATLFTHIIKGNETSRIKTKYKRKIPLRNENFILFKLAHITHGMTVSINFPEDVSVSFFNIGVISEFDTINEDFKNHICKVLNNDLVLPFQGFGMSFEKLTLNKD